MARNYSAERMDFVDFAALGSGRLWACTGHHKQAVLDCGLELMMQQLADTPV